MIDMRFIYDNIVSIIINCCLLKVEGFAAGGISNILFTNEISSPTKANRIVAVHNAFSQGFYLLFLRAFNSDIISK